MDSMEEKRAAFQKIEKLVQQAQKRIAEAEDIADKHQVSFQFSLGYGMGGTYYPKKGVDWNESSSFDDLEGWVSSSDMC